LVWIDTRDGRLLATIRYPHQPSRLIAVGPAGEAYVCGMGQAGTTCLAYQPDSKTTVWHATLGPYGSVAGGALVPGRLYVTTERGVLLAIGKGMLQEGQPPATATALRTPVPTWTLPFPALAPTPLP
jgi:hypothetical protein